MAYAMVPIFCPECVNTLEAGNIICSKQNNIEIWQMHREEGRIQYSPWTLLLIEPIMSLIQLYDIISEDQMVLSNALLPICETGT